MKEIRIHCEWQSTHVIEVPDDFVVPDSLAEFPDDVLEELTADNAELTDWR